VVSAKVEAVLREAGSLAKPLMLVILGGEGPLPDTVRAMAAQAGVPLHRSSDRCLGALAVVTALGRTRGVDPEGPENQPSREVLPPLPARGTIPEYKAKAWLAEVMGLPIPAAALARDVEDAVAIAERLGYPVVMKVQAAALPHKSDVGGVVVGIHDATGARAAWDRIQAGASVALKGGSIDGILVEAMGEPGVELVLGARRDPQWGASVMVGLGGIWIEVLKDVRLLPASACSPEAVRAALERLRGYPLLTGIRGAPPVDLDALVDLVVRLAEVMEREPDIEEIDINPVIIHPRGKGALALDALIVTRGDGATA
jgi:acyl-CoA synthetase (NDP forming)